MKENYQEKDKKGILFFGIFITIGIITLIYWSISDREIDLKNRNLNFSGKVKKVEYDIKQLPIITVNDSTYCICNAYNTDHQIEIGDSIVKRKGSDFYILIKRNTHKIIELIH